MRLQGDRGLATNQNKENIKTTKNEYPAFYKTEDGIEVKKVKRFHLPATIE